MTNLELLHTGHVVAEHPVLQHGDGVALTADLLDFLTCAVAGMGETGALQGSGRDALTPQY